MMNTQTPRQSGFTVIEVIFVSILLAIAGILTVVQMNNLKVASNDTERKTAINAMYYALEEVYYKKHSSYPVDLTSATLPSVDPKLFTDPDGYTLGEEAFTQDELKNIIEKGDASPEVKKRLESASQGKEPNYHYDPTNCDDKGNCKSYTLRADLTAEAQYVKPSRHK